MTHKEWEILCRTQITYLHSYYILQAALSDPEVVDLPLVKAQATPLEWLLKKLEVGFASNSEIMYVRMRGNSADAEQLRTIVDAVCDAYLNEAVYNEQQRSALMRDALQRSLSKLNDEIRRKLDIQNSLASELGAADQDGKSRVMQDIDIKRLDRIESELLRLEDEQLSAQIYSDQQKGKLSPQEIARLPFYERRIAELSDRQKNLEKRIAARSKSSVELTVQARELEQLQKVAREMSVKIEIMDVEAVAPNRIRLIQKAM